MKRYFKYFILFGLANFQSQLQAQSPTTLPEVVVVAKPLIEESKIDAHSAVSTIVSKNQLKDLNAIDLASALRRTPGVQISRYNPVGSFGGDQGGAVFIRGMGVSRPGSEIKTYIDGIPFYMGLWGHPLLDLLPINGMQNITIYKSPQPHIAGNNFASLNLQSQRFLPDSIKIEGDARISVGSFETFVEQANLAGRKGKMYYSIAQGTARSSGHRANASGQLNNVLSNVGFIINDVWSAEAKFLYTNNQSKDPGDARTILPTVAPQYNTEASMFSVGLKHQYKKIKGDFKVYSNKGKGAWLDLPAPDGATISNFTMSGIRWDEQLKIWDQTELTLGADYEYSGGSADFNRIAPAPQSQYESPAFSLFSPYIAINQKFSLNKKWQLRPAIAIRYATHTKFESSLAPSAGITLESNQFALFSNVSKGINYPGLEVPLLSSLIPPLADSWLGLSPEELNHFEVGFKWSPSTNMQLDISVFRDNVKNRYVFGFPPNVPPPPQFINLGEYRIQGLEASLRQDFAKQWQSFIGFTLLNPSISNLPYTPKKALNIGVNGKIRRFTLVFDAQYQSETLALNRTRVAGDTNTEHIDGFTVLNARIGYKLPLLSQEGEIFTNIENLLNTSYSYRPGYLMPERWFQAGISVSFKKSK